MYIETARQKKLTDDNNAAMTQCDQNEARFVLSVSVINTFFLFVSLTRLGS